MINKIILVDSELGEMLYERAAGDDFTWLVSFPRQDGKPGKRSSAINGTEMLWQVAVATQEENGE